MLDIGEDRETRRLTELAALDVFRDEAGPQFDMICRLAARLLNAEISMITVVEKDQIRFRSTLGSTLSAVPRGNLACEHVVECNDLLVLPDIDKPVPASIDVSLIRSVGGRFYAGVPLRTSSGIAVGSVCVIASQPRDDLDPNMTEVLNDLSRLASEIIEAGRRAEQLKAANRRMQLVSNVLRMVAVSENFEQACAQVAALMCEAMSAHVVRLFLKIPNTDLVSLVAATGQGATPESAGSCVDENRMMPSSGRLLGAVMESGEAFACPDLSRVDLSAYPNSLYWAANSEPGVIIVPVKVVGERMALSIGLEANRPDFDQMVQLATDVADAIHPLLQRMKAESEAQLFRRIVDASPDPVLITDTESIDEPGPRIVYANLAFYTETGYRPQDVIGKSPRFQQGAGTSRIARTRIREALSNWRPVRQTLLNYRADGTPRYIELHIAPVANEAGWFTHWVSVQRDLTDSIENTRQRRQAMREMRAMLSAMPGGVITYGLNKVGSWDKRFVSASMMQVTGSAIGEVQPPGWLRKHTTEEELEAFRVARVNASVKGTNTVEFRFLDNQGQYRLMHVRMSGYYNSRNEREVVTVWTDVTRERRLSAQMDQAGRLAELGQLATGLAHELAQPLAGITMASENALRQLNRPEPALGTVAEKLERIAKLSHRASSVIGHVRDFGRLDSGKAIAVDMKTIVENVVMLINPKMLEASVEVMVDVPDDLPMLFVRPMAVEQVLVNLVVNAADAFGPERPDHNNPHRRLVKIAAEPMQGCIRITVRDNAGGIPADALKQIFQPFFTTKPVGKGTGLGLSICAELIEGMGGTITAGNDDEGAVFRIELPTETCRLV